MAFRQSWSHVKRAAEPTTFVGKYGLKRTGGLTDVGKECFVIPLDMANGISCIPHHTVKKGSTEGFKGSTFASTKIVCKRYDPETGVPSKELPLCCKIAQMEKDRLSDPEDSSRRMMGFSSFRYVFPVLVLSTTETDPNKKPTLKKLSLDGVNFSFLDLAETSYEEELKGKVIEAMTEEGIIEDPEGMDQEELMQQVADYISHSIIKVANVKAKSPAIPYQKSFRVVPVTNSLIGQQSGEANTIKVLCKLLAGEYKPEQLDKVYAKYPNLREINNQVIDFLQLYNDNVDTLVESWTEEELKKYYDSFLSDQEQVEKYKAVNETAVSQEDEEEVSFRTNSSDDDEDEFESLESDDSLDSVDLDVESDAGNDDDDFDIEDEIEEAPKAKKATKKAAPKKVAVAAGGVDSDDFEVDDIDTDAADDLVEEDFAMGDDDFEELL